MGYLYHFFSVVLMASSPLINKFSVQGLSPVIAALVNCLSVAIIGVLFTCRRSQDWKLILKSKKSLMSGAANALGLLFLFLALSNEQPATVGLLGRLYIPMSSILAVFILKERVTVAGLLLLVVAFSGMLLFAWSSTFSLVANQGQIFALLFAFFFALTNIFGKEANISPWVTVAFNHLVGAIMLGIFTCISEPNFIRILVTSDGLRSAELSMLSGVIGGFLGLGFFFKGLQFISIFESNLIRCTSPLFVLAFSYPFFPVDWNFYKVIGSILLMSSSILWVLQEVAFKPIKTQLES
jgi:drug/metabolite transporter (DMT)-like permease